MSSEVSFASLCGRWMYLATFHGFLTSERIQVISSKLTTLNESEKIISALENEFQEWMAKKT